MNRLLPIMVLAVCTAVSIPAEAQQSDPLRVVRAIELPAAVKGSLGHLAADAIHNRLFVIAEDEQAILVVDLSSGTVTHQITGVGKPRAVLYRADQNRIYVTDGADGAVKIFDGTTYLTLKTVPLAMDAGSIGYDGARQLLYVDNGGKAAGNKFSQLSVVDAASASKIADIMIDGDALEAMALDVFRPRMYLNNKARNEIEVIDRWKSAVIASWPVALCKENAALALDEQRQRLFVGCHSGKISVFDTNTGKELQALTAPSALRDVAYDSDAKRLYAAGDGVVSVYEQTDADRYKPMGDTQTGAGANAAALVPALNRYFVAVPRKNSKNAAILEMEPAGAAPTRVGEPPVRVKVEAPAGQQLLLATMSAHPYLRKMGIHAIPPGGSESVIVANVLASRAGVKSSDGDLEAVKDGKTFCVKRDDGAFYNLKMPMFDAAGRKFGILVMEIPYTSASDEADAAHQAEQLRTELARQIPSLGSLFQFATNVSAPYARKLVDEALAANPGVQKMGIHAKPPDSQDSMVIANGIPGKIGKKSSAKDLSVVASGQPTVVKVNGNSPFYDLALPLKDAEGNTVGLIVMEIRATAATDEADALQQAQKITRGIEARIPNQAALFANN